MAHVFNAFSGDYIPIRAGVQVRANVGDLCPAQELAFAFIDTFESEALALSK